MADEEGWYIDPYGRHEARWYSDGRPTKLVRDGTVEGYEDPPDQPPAKPPVPVPSPLARKNPVHHGEDLRRADAAERDDSYNPERASDEAWESFPEIGPSD